MLANWAKLSGFAVILAAVLSVSFLWALNYVPPQNAEWSCEAKADPNKPNEPALERFSCHTKQSINLETKAAATKEQSNQESSGGVKITDIFLALFTAMLVVVTAVLIVVGIAQGNQLKHAVDAARDDFRASHRPKIRLKHIWLTSDIAAAATSITVRLVCVNTGAADASLGAIGIRCHVVGNEYLLPADPGMDANFSLGGNILQSGLNLTIPSREASVDTGRILAEHERTSVQRGRAKLYCVGWISYLDTAGRMRITGFCRVLEAPPGHAILTTENGRFRIRKHPDYEYED